MPAKLNAIIAVEKGKKSRAQTTLTNAYQLCQKEVLLSGITRVYERLNDDGETLPSESKMPQINLMEIFPTITSELIDMYDVVLTKETGNTLAKADIRIGDMVIATDVPVTYLLFLEKNLKDIHTFISKLPVLPADRRWEWDANAKVFKTDAVQTARTKKVEKPIVMYDATPEHPAQTQLITEDVIVGNWNTTHISTAIPVTQRDEMVAHVDQLIDAVKIAREEANSREVESRDIGSTIFGYIFDTA